MDKQNRKQLGAYLLFVAVAVGIVGGVFFLWQYMTTSPVADAEGLKAFLREKRMEDVEEVYDCNAHSGYFAGVYRTAGDPDLKLVLLARNPVFHDRYSYFGGGSTAGQLGRYDCNLGEGKEILLAVYGDNRGGQVDSYSFTLGEMEGGSGQLGEAFVDIFVFRDLGLQASADLRFYNEAGEEVFGWEEE